MTQNQTTKPLRDAQEAYRIAQSGYKLARLKDLRKVMKLTLWYEVELKA